MALPRLKFNASHRVVPTRVDLYLKKLGNTTGFQ